MEGLESEYEITVCASVGIARRGSTSVTTTLDSFRKAVLIPYVDKLIENIRSRFSDEGVAVVIAMSVFNPANIPQADDPTFRTYGGSSPWSIKEYQVFPSFASLCSFICLQAVYQLSGPEY